MKSFNNLKIGTRILTGFLIVVFIAAVIGGIGIFSMFTVNNTYKVAYTDSTDALAYTERISSSFQRVRMNLYGLVLAETPSDKEYYLERMEALRIDIDNNVALYEKMLSTYKYEDVALEYDLLNEIETRRAAFINRRTEIIESVGMDPKHRNEAYEYLGDGGELRTLALAVDDAIGDLIEYNINYAKNQIDVNNSRATVSTITIIVVVGVGVALAIIVALYIARGISNKVALLVEAADKLAVGDIDVHVEAETKDEIGQLMHSFEQMIQNTRQQALIAERIAGGDLTVSVAVKSNKDVLGINLKELVEKNNEVLSNIAMASDQVSAGSDQVAAGAQALSQGATEQASSVEELTATITEITEDMKSSADSARLAKKLSEEAGNDVVSSNQQMQRLMGAMEKISATSQEIEKIIKTIEDIAFQTNILALNAAVEAARAGEAGKGFAVVADEVRNLAAKSAEAANSTTELIGDTLNAIEEGRQLTTNTASSLNLVADKTRSVDQQVHQIAEDIEREAHAMVQIAAGVDQISAVVQTNSATSEESAAASEELAGQANLLKDQISKFKLTGTH